jgi:hypothetical protein
MSAVERADADLERGDYGMARERLASYLNSKGYDAELLQRLGRLSYEMRDLAQAGRYWLASAGGGDDVEKAVAAFIRRSGNDPTSVAAQLPRVVREASPDSLPPIPKERLRRLGLLDEIGRVVHRQESQQTTWRGRIALGLVALLVLLCVLAWGVGVHAIIRWLF